MLILLRKEFCTYIDITVVWTKIMLVLLVSTTITTKKFHRFFLSRKKTTAKMGNCLLRNPIFALVKSQLADSKKLKSLKTKVSHLKRQHCTPRETLLHNFVHFQVLQPKSK